MKVTVCELNDAPEAFARDWERLVAHVGAERSELVLLPEMPFHPWFGASPVFDERVWQAALAAHDAWQERLAELAPAIVLGTRPVNRGGQRLNEGFCRAQEMGYRIAHHKYYLPNEEGFWEASWYSRGDGSFTPLQCGAARVGFEICTELWAFDRARIYGKEGVHIIVTPRATPHSTLDKWVVGGRAAAITAGAFSLSSNHVSSASDAVHLGGLGWVIAPDGEVLGLTSPEHPFVTVELDLSAAERARHTYPRYVF
ncbi:MAG TPA: carbon-nitrogen hydrolase family protein [Blastocatellia bacterium]|nr:carbon-nitrogen hydrolase family protein [Blastocatellia bacterium]